MINLFKTKPAQKSTKEIIEEIHDSFYTEVDNLLAEAKIEKSLSTDKQDLIEKQNKLTSLGFHNTKEVKEANEEILRLQKLEKENVSKKELIEAINYFSFKYPYYKFITEESVKKICEKYNLIYSTVDRYTGTVPDSNIKQMLEFKIQEEDECYEKELSVRGFMRRVNTSLISFQEKEMLKNDLEYSDPIFLLDDLYRTIIKKLPLEICAPIKDFDLQGHELKDFKLSKIEIPDPVVLQPVFFKGKKHYLIVTAWGDEASDELVVNQNMN
jgi:hypothetical protein